MLVRVLRVISICQNDRIFSMEPESGQCPPIPNPLFVLKELGGWETPEMVEKYAQLNAGHLAEYVNAVTFWAQQQAEKKKTAC